LNHVLGLDEAENLLMQAVQRNPSSWRAVRELGDFYKHEKKTGMALDYYAKATQIAPRKGKDRALIFREYGILLRDAGTPDALQKAADALEVALKETPNDPVCIFVLGQVLCRRQMFVRAMPLLEKLGNSEDLKSRQNAYPLLKKCYEANNDILKIAELRERATRDGFQFR
jgi:tetratricopeptide (TPR) repeat protein